MYSTSGADYYQPYPAQSNYAAPASKQPVYGAGNASYQQQSSNAANNSYHAPYNGSSNQASYVPANGAQNSVLSGEDVQVMNESASAMNGSTSTYAPTQANESQWNGQYSYASQAQYGAPTQPSYPTQPQQAASYGSAPAGTAYNDQQQPAGYSYAAQGNMEQAAPRNSYEQPGARAAYNEGPNKPRRLDPETLPSVLQVLAQNKSDFKGPFRTGVRGEVPPVTYNDCVIEDGGLSSPRFVRATMNTVPCSSDLAKQVGLPVGLVITPFARVPQTEWPRDTKQIQGVPLADNTGTEGPMRCVRCKAYVSPLMQFIDGGRRFTCPLCSADSDVPEHYFAHLDHNGKRVDVMGRPELRFGTYELPTSLEYCRNKEACPPPAFIFVLDASYQSLNSGLFQLVCARLRNDILLRLPSESDQSSSVRIGLLTYGSVIQFYSFDATTGKPSAFVLSELDDVFVPSLSHLLVPVNAQTLPVIDSLLQQLPALAASQSNVSETMLAPAVQAGLAALQAASTCGRLVVVHTGLPTAEAPGKLRIRDDRKNAGGDKLRQLFVAENPFYTKLAQQCVSAGVGVDLFLFPNAYCDVATLSDLPRVTGGNLFRYPNFQAAVDGERFINDLRMTLERPCGFDAVMRVRCSGGIRAVDFYGNMHMQNANDVELGLVDSEKSIAVEIRYDDKITEEEGCFLQIALLYTSVSGQRRLRIFNMALSASANLAEIYKGLDADAVLNLVSKSAIRTLLSKSTQEVEHSLTGQCVHTLACYRKNCAQPAAAAQLILPEVMKAYPQLLNGALKSGALRGCSEFTIDDRCQAMFQLNEMGTRQSSAYFYPRLMALHTDESGPDEMPTLQRCSADKLLENGAFLIENGLLMFLWIGQSCPPEFLWNVFGISQFNQIVENQAGCELPALDNPLSIRVCRIVAQIREQRSRHLKLIIVKQRGQLESWLQHFLVEDQCPDGASAYSDYLLQLHKEIRSHLG